MTANELQEGHWYWLRGTGAWKLLDVAYLPERRAVDGTLREARYALRMQSVHGNVYNWFDLEDVMHEMDQTRWTHYRGEMDARGLGPHHWPPEALTDEERALHPSREE